MVHEPVTIIRQTISCFLKPENIFLSASKQILLPKLVHAKAFKICIETTLTIENAAFVHQVDKIAERSIKLGLR